MENRKKYLIIAIFLGLIGALILSAILVATGCEMTLQPTNLLTWSIGFATVAILWLQYRLARRHERVLQLKNRLDLFEKRWAIYMKVKELFSKILTSARIDYDSLIGFLRQTDERIFLFGKDIPSYIDEIYEKGCDLARSSGQLDRNELPLEQERNEMSKLREEAIDWFRSQTSVFAEKFRKYLDVSELH